MIHGGNWIGIGNAIGKRDDQPQMFQVEDKNKLVREVGKGTRVPGQKRRQDSAWVEKTSGVIKRCGKSPLDI